jgi:2-C-methyl-D-erythritol 4-phosphate cytidylyltransferase
LPAISYWLVMPAAGSGARLHEDADVGARAGAEAWPAVPKQYLPLAGATVIEHALAPFRADARCEGIVVSLAAGDRWWQTLPVARDPRVVTVTGGRERCDSVAAGLAAVRARVGVRDPWVLVHDAARPCASAEELARLLAAIEHAPHGALLALRITDTVKRAGEDGCVGETVDRARLWRALTPQAFRLRRLEAALATGTPASDEAGAVERLGDRPRLVPGSPLNIKITAAADLELARRVLGGPQA